MANVEKMIAETFLEMAQGLESGSYGKRPKIALTGMGSEPWRRECHGSSPDGSKRWR